MSALLQRLAVRARPRAALPACTALCAAAAAAPAVRATAVLSLRWAATYRNPNDPASDDDDGPAAAPRPTYKNKKVWPPDFTRLSPQEQLRFEKRFKRRVALASARPRWVKFVKLAQLFSVTFVVIYCVLFMEWEYGPQPFQGVRDWFWQTLAVLKGGQPQSSLRKPGDSSGRPDAATMARTEK